MVASLIFCHFVRFFFKINFLTLFATVILLVGAVDFVAVLIPTQEKVLAITDISSSASVAILDEVRATNKLHHCVLAVVSGLVSLLQYYAMKAEEKEAIEAATKIK